MNSYIQILCRFQKCNQKVPPPLLLSNGIIKGPESWWIAKSITISRVVNQSKIHQLSGPLISTFQYGPVIKLPLQILPSIHGQPYEIDQSATVIAD